jgi:hypothetical protein
MSIVFVEVVGYNEIYNTIAKLGAINDMCNKTRGHGQCMLDDSAGNCLWPIEVLHITGREYRILCICGDAAVALVREFGRRYGLCFANESLPVSYITLTRIPQRKQSSTPPHIEICMTLILILESAFKKWMSEPGTRNVFEYFWKLWPRSHLGKRQKGHLTDAMRYWREAFEDCRSESSPKMPTLPPSQPQPPPPPQGPPPPMSDLKSISRPPPPSPATSSDEENEVYVRLPGIVNGYRSEGGLNLIDMAALFEVTSRMSESIWRSATSPVEMRFGRLVATSFS